MEEEDVGGMALPPNISVPELNDPFVGLLIKEIGTTGQPVRVPHLLVEDAVDKECIQNVIRFMGVRGGNQIHGWQLWKAKYIIEAEFHSVWQSDTGKMFNLVGDASDDYDILFLPDRSVEYKGEIIDNVRVPLDNRKIVAEFILVNHLKYIIRNGGKRPYESETFLKSHELEWFNVVEATIRGIHSMMECGFDINHSCFCGSRKSLISCHLNVIRELEEAIARQ